MSESPSRPVTKAVIPVAGLGTRFLPATKSLPKEMLPVVDRPAIEYVVEEAAHAGLTDVLLITGRGKSAIEEHFDRSPDLERVLEAKGDEARLALVRHSASLANVHSVRQGDPKGLGHAVLQAESHVGGETFAVFLGDDLIDPRDAVIGTMLEIAAAKGGSVLCLMEVPPEAISAYGCAAVEATDDPGIVKVVDLVEKPAVDEAPSNLAVIGRYVLDPEVFGVLHTTEPGRGGEIQLTDALRVLATDGAHNGVHGVIFRGRRYDTGDKLSYLKAVVTLAAEHDDLGTQFATWLREYATSLTEPEA